MPYVRPAMTVQLQPVGKLRRIRSAVLWRIARALDRIAEATR